MLLPPKHETDFSHLISHLGPNRPPHLSHYFPVRTGLVGDCVTMPFGDLHRAHYVASVFVGKQWPDCDLAIND